MFVLTSYTHTIEEEEEEEEKEERLDLRLSLTHRACHTTRVAFHTSRILIESSVELDTL